MNSERLLKLADRVQKTHHVKRKQINEKGSAFKGAADLDQPLNGFTMQEAFPAYWKKGRCGCIMAHCAEMYDLFSEVGPQTLSKVTGRYLGLDPVEADNLFYPRTGLPWDRITPRKAAKVIRKVADGEKPYKAWLTVCGGG